MKQKKFLLLFTLLIATVVYASSGRTLLSDLGFTSGVDIDVSTLTTNPSVEDVITTPLEDGMEISAADLNAKFNALNYKINNLNTSISSCNELSIDQNIFGQNVNISDSSCVSNGCFINVNQTACVTDCGADDIDSDGFSCVEVPSFPDYYIGGAGSYPTAEGYLDGALPLDEYISDFHPLNYQARPSTTISSDNLLQKDLSLLASVFAGNPDVLNYQNYELYNFLQNESGRVCRLHFYSIFIPPNGTSGSLNVTIYKKVGTEYQSLTVQECDDMATSSGVFGAKNGDFYY